MLSLGILAAGHLSSTMRRRGFISGSAPPNLAAMLISLLSLEKILPRWASIAPLKCLTLAHLLCPAIKSLSLLLLSASPGNHLRTQEQVRKIAGIFCGEPPEIQPATAPTTFGLKGLF